jgi:hypothetical protein
MPNSWLGSGQTSKDHLNRPLLDHAIHDGIGQREAPHPELHMDREITSEQLL